MILKRVSFLGDSLEQLRSFPHGPRREAGYQIDRLQRGLDPDDWKPMKTVGVGVREIRVRDARGAFRVIYMASFADAVYVIHAFQKKTRVTSNADIDLATKRLRALRLRLQL